MSLSPAEKATGRAWRAQQMFELARLNKISPPDMVLPPHVRHVRHLCAGNGGKSVSFDYSEVYVCAPDGKIAFVYHEGRCPDCRITARSDYGFIVETAARPPSGGRVVRQG